MVCAHQRTENIAYGGINIESNSGVLKYVRIEFAGKRTKEIRLPQCIDFAGVGNKTIIENVMVSYSAGNSFNILGGSVI